MMARRETLVPLVHMLRAKMNANMPLPNVFSEAIDNSLDDAKGAASTISIDVMPDEIRFIDDGVGMDNVNRAFQLGNTSSYESLTDIGRYGVGITDASLSSGDVMEVWTVHEGMVNHHRVDWQRCLRIDDWPPVRKNPPVPLHKVRRRAGLEALFEKGHGTLVVFSRLRDNVGHRFNFESISKLLGLRYAPALRSGKAIMLRFQPKTARAAGLRDWTPIEPVQIPELVEKFEFSGSVDGTNDDDIPVILPWRATAGLSQSLSSDLNRVFIGYGHRVIEATTDPFGEFIGRGMHVTVDLGATWRSCLSAHKDAIVRSRGELISQLHRALRPMLARADELQRSLKLEAIEAMLNEVMGQVVQGKRPTRPKKPVLHPTGARKPKKKKHQKDGVPPGDGVDKAAGDDHGIQIVFGVLSSGNVAEAQLRYTDGHRRIMVTLNKEHPGLKAAQKDPVNSLLLLHVAAMHIALVVADKTVEDAAILDIIPRAKKELGEERAWPKIIAAIERAIMFSDDVTRERGPDHGNA
jgi:hypothetical protein